MPPKESFTSSPAASSPALAALFSASPSASAAVLGSQRNRPGSSQATPAAGGSLPHSALVNNHPTPLQPSIALTPAAAAAASTPQRALNIGHPSPQPQGLPQRSQPPQPQRRAPPVKGISEDVAEMESALDELQRRGSRFYDEIESQLGPQADPIAVRDALDQLLHHLSATIAMASRSTVGGAPLDGSDGSDGLPAHSTTPDPLDERLTVLREQGNDAYERRMRLQEASGAVAHVLAAGGLGN
ncbi:unnamed protein product [Parajaminaea phylloscopi]